MGAVCSNTRTASGLLPDGVGPNNPPRFQRIWDCYETLEQVQEALRKEGLESSQLIVALDYTKSNEWTGQNSFNNHCLHDVSLSIPSPYASAIAIIGKTLSDFDNDHLIPCYGFGDATTGDSRVFSFKPNDQPCRGLEELQQCYRALTPSINLSGPTSFAPAIRQAIKLVSDSGNQYHILLLVADGQVTRSSSVPDGSLSPQERATIDAIVEASDYPLSIVMVGVGDGPWDDMRKFDDAIPQRRFDNFQFVNFTEVMQRERDFTRMETQFALKALMEIPEQYKIIQRLGLLGQSRRQVSPPPPPAPPPAYFFDSLPGATYSEPIKPGQAAMPMPSTGSEPVRPGGGRGYGNASGNGAREAPPLFTCPITQELMRDPVLASDGFTYEKEAIQEWLRTKNTSPMTNAPMDNMHLVPNHALRSAILEYRQNNGL